MSKIERTETCTKARLLLLSINNWTVPLAPHLRKSSQTRILVLLAVRLMEEERKQLMELKTW